MGDMSIFNNSEYSNNIIYLSPLGKKGISDIKKACIFFDKVFVPVTWTTGIISTLVIRDVSVQRSSDNS